MQNHSVTVTGLSPGTTYHYGISSTDAAGLTANRPDATFVTPVSSGPTINAWYGDHQVVGAHGRSQTCVNVLGNVADPDGVSRLTYTLNGGASKTLTVGPDRAGCRRPATSTPRSRTPTCRWATTRSSSPPVTRSTT